MRGKMDGRGWDDVGEMVFPPLTPPPHTWIGANIQIFIKIENKPALAWKTGAIRCCQQKKADSFFWIRLETDALGMLSTDWSANLKVILNCFHCDEQHLFLE